MTRALRILSIVGAALVPAAAGAATDVNFAVDADAVAGPLDEKIYGHFLEHIYHSVNGGLWGELVWNRSFEQSDVPGIWRVEGDTLAQTDLKPDVRLTFGDARWDDYLFSVEARKTDGAEGFLIMFRVADDTNFYWCNLGGWGNTKHAVEKNSGASRQIVGSSVPGRIETGRWYKIAVRCEGPAYTVSLDGQKLLEFKDADHPHASGRVGLATWNTAAQFRNFSVTRLDGEALHTGLPPAPPPPATASRWSGYGMGRCERTRDNPLNGEYCQLIDSAGPEMGLTHAPIAFKKDAVYRGSLWARGDASGKLVAHLCDVDGPVASEVLASPTLEWREYPLELKSPQTIALGAIRVGIQGTGRAWVDQVSLTPAAVAQTAGCRPDLLKAVADLRPPIIRWPGGCFAEYYRWKDGIGPQHRRVKYPIVIWDDQDTNAFGTDECIAMCRKVGAEPLIVINIGRHDAPGKRADYIREATDWIEYCNGPADSRWGRVRAANGHPEPYRVKYWEIDNETWNMGGKAYADAVNEFVPAMRKADPSIRTIVCGGAGFDMQFNKDVVAGCAAVADFISIHHYENPDKYADGPRQYEEAFRELGEVIAASVNPKMRIFVSEWNAQSTDWRTGLYAGGLLNAFERCGDVVTMASPALFLRHVSASEWDNAFVNFDHAGWFAAPNYVVMKLWRDHYGPQRLTVAGGTGPLNVSASKSADGRQVFVKIVNPTAEAVEARITLAGKRTPAEASMQLIAPDSLQARNSLTAPHNIQPVKASVDVHGNTAAVKLPRWSASVLAIGTE